MDYVNLHALFQVERGILDDARELASNVERPVVLALGCSFTNWRLWQKRFPSGYPQCLAPLLSKGTVVNFGIGGCNTITHTILAPIGKLFKPDCVIFQCIDARRNPYNSENRREYENLKEPPIDHFTYWKLRQLFLKNVPKSLFRNLTYSILKEDIDYIKKLKEFYECPFIFLLNKQGYPYAKKKIDRSYIKTLKDELSQIGTMVLTDFDQNAYRISDKDFHPNPLRQKMTAIMLAPYVQEILG